MSLDGDVISLALLSAYLLYRVYSLFLGQHKQIDGAMRVFTHFLSADEASHEDIVARAMMVVALFIIEGVKRTTGKWARGAALIYYTYAGVRIDA